MEKITLRNVEKKDWDFILQLRNSLYKFFYIQKKPLEKSEHYEYMEKQKSNPKFHQWIITLDENDVGYVRILDLDVGIMIHEEFQKKGIATIALSLVEKKAVELGLSKLIARIDKDNLSSKKIFEKNGYVEKNDFELKQLWLEKNIS